MPHKSFLGFSLSTAWVSTTTALTDSTVMGSFESNNGVGLLTYDGTKYINNSGNTLKLVVKQLHITTTWEYMI